jgi:hypothetical protein
MKKLYIFSILGILLFGSIAIAYLTSNVSIPMGKADKNLIESKGSMTISETICEGNGCSAYIKQNETVLVIFTFGKGASDLETTANRDSLVNGFMKRYATYLATNIETIPLGEANITITEKK